MLATQEQLDQLTPEEYSGLSLDLMGRFIKHRDTRSDRVITTVDHVVLLVINILKTQMKMSKQELEVYFRKKVEHAR